MIIDTLNEVQINTISEIRSYSIWRISRVLIALNSNVFDVTTTLTFSLLIFIVRRIIEFFYADVLTRFLNTFADVMIITSVGLILQPMVKTGNQSELQHILIVLFLASAAHVFDRLCIETQHQK